MCVSKYLEIRIGRKRGINMMVMEGEHILGVPNNIHIHARHMHLPLASNHAAQANHLSRSDRDCLLLDLHFLVDGGAYGLDAAAAAAADDDDIAAAPVPEHGEQKCSFQL